MVGRPAGGASNVIPLMCGRTMIATLYLLGCVLAPAQTSAEPPPGDARLQPHLARAQELFYRGTYGEENVGERTRYTKSYRVETRVFVLDATAKEPELAFLTVLKTRDGAAEPTTASVRLERLRVDPLGKVTAEPGLAVLLD